MKITKGMKFNAEYADTVAVWEAVRSLGNSTWLCRMAEDVGYGKGIEKPFFENDVASRIKSFEAQQQRRNDHDAFYKNLRVGAIVHYDNGFDCFVRCQVVEKDGNYVLQPISLVGKWSKRDLPQRNQNGTIYYPYYAKMIINEETFTPNSGNIVESPQYTRAWSNKVSVRELPAISLKLPPMSVQEEETAKWARIETEIGEILDSDFPSKDKIHKIYTICAEYV